MKINTYLNFYGNAEEALEFYRAALGGTLEIMRVEGSPAASMFPPDWGNKVLHGTLTTPAGVIMASDATKERVKSWGDNFAISVGTDVESEGDALFAKLSAGGKVEMPLEKSFWGSKFGMLEDKFGIAWMVNIELK